MALFASPRKKSSPLADLRGDHTGVRVPDLDAAIAWYTETLDFRMTATTEAAGSKWAFLALPNDDLFSIELAAGSGAIDREGADDLIASLKLHGWHHVALRVDRIEDTLAELTRRGIKVVAGPLEYEPIKRRGAFFSRIRGTTFSRSFKMSIPTAKLGCSPTPACTNSDWMTR